MTQQLITQDRADRFPHRTEEFVALRRHPFGGDYRSTAQRGSAVRSTTCIFELKTIPFALTPLSEPQGHREGLWPHEKISAGPLEHVRTAKEKLRKQTRQCRRQDDHWPQAPSAR